MKITAICGSPRKGNSYSTLNTIAENHPDMEHKLVMLGEANLEPCKGCYVCVHKGEDKCPLKDDMNIIVDEIMDADGIILATPVYNNHVSSLTKSFIDRLAYVAHRPRFHGKYAMVMSSCSGFGADEANEYMEGMLTVFGFTVVSAMELMTGSKSDKQKDYNQQQTMKAFSKFVAGIKKGGGKKPAPTFTQLIYFNIFKRLSEVNQKVAQADYEFYKDKTDFVYDTKVGFIKKKLTAWIAGQQIKKILKNTI